MTHHDSFSLLLEVPHLMEPKRGSMSCYGQKWTVIGTRSEEECVIAVEFQPTSPDTFKPDEILDWTSCQAVVEYKDPSDGEVRRLESPRYYRNRDLERRQPTNIADHIIGSFQLEMKLVITVFYPRPYQTIDFSKAQPAWYTDAVIVIKNTKFNVCKKTLASLDPFFKKLFFDGENTEKSEFAIDDVDVTEFQELLNLLYINSDVTIKNIEGLLNIAAQLELTNVTRRCEMVIMKRMCTFAMSPQRRLLLADKFQLTDLMNDTLNNLDAPYAVAAVIPNDPAMFSGTLMRKVLQRLQQSRKEPDEPHEVVAEVQEYSFLEPDGTIFSDVVIRVDGQEFYACRTTLASFAKEFQEMFFAGKDYSDEPRRTLENVDAEQFHTFLKLIYMKTDIYAENIADILEVGQFLCADAVVARCQKALMYMTEKECSPSKKMFLSDKFGFDDLMNGMLERVQNSNDVAMLLPTDVFQLSSKCKIQIAQKLVEVRNKEEERQRNTIRTRYDSEDYPNRYERDRAAIREYRRERELIAQPRHRF